MKQSKKPVPKGQEDHAYDREQVRAHIEEAIIDKVREIWKEVEIQQIKVFQQYKKQEGQDVDLLVFRQKIQETSQTKLFKSMADRIARCGRFKPPEQASMGKIFLDFQKLFDELHGNKKSITIKINKALEQFSLQTFKHFEDIHDDLVRLEGAGKCGGSEVQKSFEERVKQFKVFTYMWEQLPKLQNEEINEAIFRPPLNEKELRKYVGDLVLQTYPAQGGVREVERIVEVARDVERIVHKEVPVYVEKVVEKYNTVEVPQKQYKEVYQEIQKHDHTREAHEHLFGFLRHRQVPKALELYSLEADHQSNPVAMNALGHLYGEGKHVPEDKEKSVMYYNRSAKLDNPEGLYHVGSMMLVIDIEQFQRGSITAKQIGSKASTRDAELEEAITILKKAADKGSSEAMTDLGQIYEKGLRSPANNLKWMVEQDKKLAEHWYHKGANLHNPRSIVELGNFYQRHPEGPIYFTTGVPLEKAVECFKKAHQMEYVPAYYELGLCYELGQGVAKDQTQAKTYLIDGSVKGSIACIEHLIDYLWKECLASKNEMDYIKLYNYLRQTILAHPQNGKLHYTLGMLYEHGFGIKSDPKSALLHYQKAAQLEYVDAQLKLGDWYTHGLNVPVDLVEAHRYYEKASGNGSVQATVKQGQLVLKGGPGMQPDHEKAFNCFSQASDQGDVEGMFHKALMYDIGLHVTQDTEKSVDLLTQAESKGHFPSKLALAQKGLQRNDMGAWGPIVQFDDDEGANIAPFHADFSQLGAKAPTKSEFVAVSLMQSEIKPRIIEPPKDRSYLLSQMPPMATSAMLSKAFNSYPKVNSKAPSKDFTQKAQIGHLEQSYIVGNGQINPPKQSAPSFGKPLQPRQHVEFTDE